MSIDRMLSWFPNTWRSRYEAEVRELLEARPFGWPERRDLLRCCVDAWFREGTSWGLALLRLSSALGVRLAVVFGVGWVGLLGVAYVDSVIGVRLWNNEWRDAATAAQGMIFFLQMFAFLMISLRVLAPYARSGAEVDRPSVSTTLLATGGFAVLQWLDQSPAHLGDIILFGMIATMRYARWLEFMRFPPRHLPSSMLGLR